jgi:hypothetical protein
MSSWIIVRDFLTMGAKPETVGYQVKLVAASDLFIRLLDCLTESEREVAFEEWKREPHLVEALSRRSDFQDIGLLKTNKTNP